MLLLIGSCSTPKVKIPVRFDPESDPFRNPILVFLTATDCFKGSRTATFPGLFSRGLETLPLKTKYFEILTHHYMRGLTKNSKIFQTLLRQERYHIVSDPLGY